MAGHGTTSLSLARSL